MIRNILFAAGIACALAGCNTLQSPAPQARAESPEMQKARAICQDAVATDVGHEVREVMIDSCIPQRLREIRAGLR